MAAGAGAGADLHGWPLGAQLRALTVGPVERPSSSPRPDIGEVYADGVLLVWKPVESYGPVTYIVQCSLEGRPAPVPSPPGRTQEAPGPLCIPSTVGGSVGPFFTPGQPPTGMHLSTPPPPPDCGVGRTGVPLTCCVWPGGSWSTLASDIFDCCYLVSKLSRGGTYAFRTACVSKAGMGPYSSPSEQVLLGGPSHLGEPLQGLAGGCGPSRTVLPLHQNIYLLGRFVQVQGMRG